MAIAILSAFVFLFAKGVAWLYLGPILSGLGIGVVTGTGTAWLIELIAHKDKSRATTIVTSTNFLGLATSALIAGILAQYAPWPLQLPFVVYLVVLLSVTDATQWNESRRCHLISRKDGFKQPFEF